MSLGPFRGKCWHCGHDHDRFFVPLEPRRNELCIEDDGDIGVDWHTPERDQLSISLSEDGSIAWAVLTADGRKAHGTAQLAAEAFEVLRKLVPNA